MVNCTGQLDKMGISFTWAVALPEEVKAALDSRFTTLQPSKGRFREMSQSVLVLEPHRYYEQHFLRETRSLSKKQYFFLRKKKIILTVFKATQVLFWPFNFV